jgi:hypothetical protein
MLSFLLVATENFRLLEGCTLLHPLPPLSRPLSVSDSDTDHPITNYVSDVSTGEASKVVQGQATKTKTNNKVKCN